MRPRKRRCCSSSVIENQYLISWMPERTSIRSNSGTVRKNSSYSLVGAEAHHPLDAGAVVPAAVEQHHLAGRRQVGHIALEVPLRALAVVRRRQRRHPAHARVEPLRDALDDAALAGGVAALEQDHDLLPAVHHPVLQLHQLALQPEQLAEVGLRGPPCRVIGAPMPARRGCGPRAPARSPRRSCPPGRGAMRAINSSWSPRVPGRVMVFSLRGDRAIPHAAAAG